MSFEAVPIEQVREYWDRRPCNIRHSRKPVGSREYSRHGAWVTAVDLSERSLTVARQQAGVFGLQQMIRFYQGRGEELRSMVPAEPFDLIYSFGVIHHRSARELVGRGGFRVTEMWLDHLFPYRVREYTEYRNVKALPFRRLPSPVMRQLEKWLGWHLCLTAVKTSEYENLGG